jgi:branched-chain amino acid transport system substrate-binding protein
LILGPDDETPDATGLLSAAASTVFAQIPIKIGEINSYSAMPQFTQLYKQGWQLAVEETNAKGGLLGR